MEEIWRQVVNYDYEPINGYEVSNLGNVRSLDRVKLGKKHSISKQKGRMLKYFIKKGTEYRRVALNSSKKYYVHTLVALAFPEICGTYEKGLTVDHLNAKKDDNRAENLKWCTISENLRNPITFPKFVENSRYQLYLINQNKPLLDKINRLRRKKVRCIESGIIYSCRFEAAKDTGANACSIWKCCAKKQNTANGFHFEYA